MICKIALCGRSMAGKDESGLIISRLSALRYGGSLSRIILPEVAAAQGLPVEQAWRERHQHYQFWIDWCDAARRQDPAAIARRAARIVDLVIGIRDDTELALARREGLIDLSVWIERDVPPDPTLRYGPEACDEVIGNHGTVEDLERLWCSWLPAHGIPLQADATTRDCVRTRY